MRDFVGLRLNTSKDADIIKDLGKYTDATARVKETYRRALQLEGQQYIPGVAPRAMQRVEQPQEQAAVSSIIPKKPEVLVWNFPTEPSVRVSNVAPTSVKANILSNGF
jgi:hypothetical protein